MTHINGEDKSMEKLHDDIFYLRESVGFQINKLTDVVSGLNDNVQTQNKILEGYMRFFESYIKMQRWALPMPLVTMMFMVLLVLIFGKESIEWFYQHKLFQVNPQ